MRTDDDIFENLDIDGDHDDEPIFEEFDMEDRIFSQAVQSGRKKELNTPDSSIDRDALEKDKNSARRSLIKKIVAGAVVEILTLVVIFTYGYFLRNWNLIQRIEVNAQAVENTNLSIEKRQEMEEGYWLIAVFGVDGRSSSLVERGLNSDVIIIVSINRENGDIKLVSVFRDTYLNISDSNLYNKINQAYSMGGPEQALAALNKNLDLNITEYVVFNWKAVVDGINILGGVDGISISKAELYYINAYITETVKVTGIGSYQLTSTGTQHLDGVQAVAYARLRYMDSDYARTERQRNVIKACFEKAKTADFSVLNNIMVTCFPQVATNVNFNNIVAMAQNVTRYNIADTAGFPWQRGEAVMGNKGDCVIPATLESNVKLLHEFLFDIADYTPTDAVLSISETIKANSKIYKEGQVVTSVSTSGGVIQSPKTQTTAAAGEDDEDEEEEPTIGVDENGLYIYPTNADGDIVYPTDEDGNVIYPTDEDGNVIKESGSIVGSRPTELLEDESAPGEGTVAPGETSATTASPGETSATTASPGETSATTASPGETSGGPGESTTETSSSGPGVVTSGDNIISSEGPGSVTTTTTADGPVISDAPV